jgi:NitT/TauT family transport system substrate-binding protein
MRPIQRLFACAALAMAVLLGGCSPGKAPPLRVGINPWPTYDLVWVAEQKGYFRELGLDVRLEQFPGVSDTFLALDRGRIDVAALTTAEVVHSRVPLVPLFVLNQSIGLDAVVGGPDVATLADLAGKRVGLEPDSVGGVLLHAALSSAGLEAGDVDIVLLSQATGEEMLKSGMIDAIVTYPPLLSRVERLPGTKRLFDTAQAPGLVYDFLAAPQAVVDARRGELDLLVEGYQRALQLLREHPAEVHAMIARRHNLSEQEAAAWFENGIEIYRAAEQERLLAEGGPVASSIAQARVAVAAFAVERR